ncbi:MAG TPA: glucose-6-phosphate isomerase [Oligoflexia bacterium]|nr:glucose-6-phosphate isomerase [Oligoflexia bacterium]HMP27029.1 glucose-6-phosphate isomerase [Oligoflexia bacterium]
MDNFQKFKNNFFEFPEIGISLDFGSAPFTESFLAAEKERAKLAVDSMLKLVAGSIANPDENQLVGHYWLRNPSLAPSAEIKTAISTEIEKIKNFAAKIHSGEIKTSSNQPFKHILLIGIGGSALGPMFVGHALKSSTDKLDLKIIDNTDPDGIAATIKAIPSLKQTLVIVISKSGSTKETRNGELLVANAFKRALLDFPRHAVAITMKDSALDRRAAASGWLERFHIWSHTGGRTSQTSAVGLLPGALQGWDTESFLQGARDMDELTIRPQTVLNPALLLALAILRLTKSKSDRSMVVLPYKDRLELLSRYLQQLFMESLGKERDLDGKTVNQGLAIYGNKGSTDQHALVQQLRDGPNNFFTLFIEVLKDDFYKSERDLCDTDLEVEEGGITAGDYLQGFYLGTRRALEEKGRESITVVLPEISEYTIGALIALFERVVGFYASFINVNCYNQPGVEAGKKAAAEALEIKKRAAKLIAEKNCQPNFENLQEYFSANEQATLFKILQRIKTSEIKKHSY